MYPSEVREDTRNARSGTKEYGPLYVANLRSTDRILEPIGGGTLGKRKAESVKSIWLIPVVGCATIRFANRESSLVGACFAGSNWKVDKA